MFDTLKNAWRIKEVRKKILFTLVIILIYAFVSKVPTPGVDPSVIKDKFNSSEISIHGFLNTLNGGALEGYTIMAMGISPYINASIIMQLLTVIFPSLQAMQKEGGEEGKKKMQKLQRIITIAIAFVMAIGILLGLGKDAVTDNSIWNYLLIGICITAGSALAMFLGEQITAKGIGNGVSMLIFTGIISSVSLQVVGAVGQIIASPLEAWAYLGILIMVAVMLVAVVFIDEGKRKIPVHYAKRQVGRKMYGGQSTFIPIKVNSSGVMPIIFANSFLTFPSLIASFWPNSGFQVFVERWLGTSGWFYLPLLALLIYGFTFFYSSISFDPIEMSKNLQQNGGSIPGIRPGKPTSEYLDRVSKRLLKFGGLFLAILATVPTLLTILINKPNPFGTTSILIIVSVALETTRQLEAQLLMRHYKGFLKN